MKEITKKTIGRPDLLEPTARKRPEQNTAPLERLLNNNEAPGSQRLLISPTGVVSPITGSALPAQRTTHVLVSRTPREPNYAVTLSAPTGGSVSEKIDAVIQAADKVSALGAATHACTIDLSGADLTGKVLDHQGKPWVNKKYTVAQTAKFRRPQ